MSAKELKSILKKLENPEQAQIYLRFFKTGKGEYGEGDKFLGIKVPVLRQISKKFKDLLLIGIQELLDSQIHEERMIGLFILVEQFRKADEDQKKSYLLAIS